MSDTEKKVPSLEEIELRAYEVFLKLVDADGVALEVEPDSWMNLLRWTSPRIVKETYLAQADWRPRSRPAAR